jgi:glycine cleavage system H protein
MEAVSVPADLKYTKSHEWIRIEDGVATVGITEHAQSELGDVVFVELPSPGRAVQDEETFGTVESVKTVSDLYAPLPGEIIEVNEALGSQSELVNSDPYGEGWMVKIKVADGFDEGSLLDAAAYQQVLDEA